MSPDSKLQRVSRRTARTIPWVMGTLAAGLREHGEGLHPAQLKLLMAMHHGPVSPSEVAERMEVSMPTISKTLAVLERRGLVERSVDPDDRRRVQLVMTKDGHTTLRKVLDAGVEQLGQVLAVATPEELDSIEQGMDSLSEVLARANPEHHGHHFKRSTPGNESSR